MCACECVSLYWRNLLIATNAVKGGKRGVRVEEECEWKKRVRVGESR